MNALDFLKTAKLLKDNTGEASIRTIVGRAYYAMIIHIKCKIEKLMGKKYLDQENIHRWVPSYFGKSKITQLEEYSRIIADFRRKRNSADYDMDEMFGEMDKMYLTTAESIINAFDSISEQRLKASILQYQRNKNRVSS